MKHILKEIYWIVLSAVSLLFFSCSDKWDGGTNKPLVPGQYAVVAKTSGFGQETSATDSIENIHICIFRDGVLSEIQTHLSERDGSFPLTVGNMSGNMYVLVNTDNLVDWEALKSTGLSEMEWLNTVVAGTEPIHYFTGYLNLDDVAEGNYMLPVQMHRGVARFDLEIFSAEKLTVDKVVFSGLMSEAYLLPQATVTSPEQSILWNDTVNFVVPIEHNKDGIAYFYEQANSALTVAVSLTVAGKSIVKEARLPEQIRRNTAYSIVLKKDTYTSEITMEVIEWAREDDTMATPDFGTPIMVDVSRSTLPEDIEVTDNGQTIILPYTDVDAILALDCADELQYLEEDVNGLSVEPIMAEDGMTATNMYRIRKEWWRLGVPGENISFRFKRKGLELVYPDDYIKVVLSENPTKIEGLMDFTHGYEYDFAKYIDNELGRLEIPENKRLLIEYDADEDPWIKLETSTENSNQIRVLAGWKPNDRTANGRKQAARLILSNEDGSHREEYTVVRRNWGLPVTQQAGIWWCKYNAMGNSRDFSDQILSSADPAVLAGQTLFDYLGSCSPEQYFELWKWEYQGDSGQGLQVKNIDGIAKLEGFKTGITVHMNTLEPTYLAPDGYEIPSHDDFGRLFLTTGDYVWIMWDGSHVSPWNGGTTIQRRNKRRNDIALDSLLLDNLFYMAMYENGVTQNEPVVWYGAGAQWNDSGVKHAHYNNILFTTYSPQKKGWYFNGAMTAFYITQNGAGNNDTRIVRFKKSDVEYIYGID